MWSDGRRERMGLRVQDGERREKKSETRCIPIDGDVDSDRPFTTCLSRKFQQDTKEALCLLGLKKKIARLYAHEPERYQKEEDQGQTGKSRGQGRKGSMPKAEIIPVKRKRGRPPKNKTKHETPKHAITTEGQQLKCMPHSEEPLKVRTSRSRGKRETKSVIRALAPLRMCPVRRARPSKRSLLIDDGSNSSSCSDFVEDDEEGQGEEEVGADVKKVSRRRRRKLFSDEALALQLHLDLNAPMLRRRRRSGGLMSPSSSEQ